MNGINTFVESKTWEESGGKRERDNCGGGKEKISYLRPLLRILVCLFRSESEWLGKKGEEKKEQQKERGKRENAIPALAAALDS